MRPTMGNHQLSGWKASGWQALTFQTWRFQPSARDS